MRIRLLVFTIILIILSILCFFEYGELNEVEAIDEVQTINYLPIDEYEMHLLAKIAMAEAEGESLEGKVLVMNVVLNRVHSQQFPDTIEEVIFQKNQFSPIIDGRFDKVTPNDECWEALELVRTGYDISYGALYFISDMDPNSWHNRNLEALFVEGNHKFYK